MVVVFVVQGSGVCGQFCLVVVDHKLADRPSLFLRYLTCIGKLFLSKRQREMSEIKSLEHPYLKVNK